MFYTIIPIEFIFGEEEAEPEEPQKDRDDEIEIKRGGVTLLVRPHLPGQYKVHRIISTNSLDYLKPDWQPGMIVPSIYSFNS
jgi:hypothetical protein